MYETCYHGKALSLRNTIDLMVYQGNTNQHKRYILFGERDFCFKGLHKKKREKKRAGHLRFKRQKRIEAGSERVNNFL